MGNISDQTSWIDGTSLTLCLRTWVRVFPQIVFLSWLLYPQWNLFVFFLLPSLPLFGSKQLKLEKKPLACHKCPSESRSVNLCVIPFAFQEISLAKKLYLEGYCHIYREIANLTYSFNIISPGLTSNIYTFGRGYQLRSRAFPCCDKEASINGNGPGSMLRKHSSTAAYLGGDHGPLSEGQGQSLSI